jgi:hypothetical protein
MASFPRDEFDDVPDGDGRVGAHRAPARRGRGWIAFAWAALATGVLILVGLFALSRLDAGFQLPSLPIGGGAPTSPSASASASPTVAAVTDPGTLSKAVLAKLTISVLNGTADDQLDDKAGAALKGAGWPQPTLAQSTSSSVTTTTVYYSDAANEAIARGVAKQLGATRVQLSDAFPGASITVVLGSDYKG